MANNKPDSYMVHQELNGNDYVYIIDAETNVQHIINLPFYRKTYHPRVYEKICNEGKNGSISTISLINSLYKLALSFDLTIVEQIIGEMKKGNTETLLRLKTLQELNTFPPVEISPEDYL